MDNEKCNIQKINISNLVLNCCKDISNDYNAYIEITNKIKGSEF
jgi:hypothetical protein